MTRVLEALRWYHEAQGTQPDAEMKLRLEEEVLFTAVNEYPRQALGDPAPRLRCPLGATKGATPQS